MVLHFANGGGVVVGERVVVRVVRSTLGLCSRGKRVVLSVVL